MHQKLLAGQYPDRYAFRDDFKLIVSNARLYNISGMVVDQAEKLDGIFNKQWERIQATLRKMEPAGRKAAPEATIARPPPPPFFETEVKTAPYIAPYIAPTPVHVTSAPKGISFKIKPPQPVALLPPPPAPVDTPAKPKGFKITLGGSFSGPSPSPAPTQPAVIKIPKAHKPHKKVATFADDLEYGSTAPPISHYNESEVSLKIKTYSSKKGKEKDKGKEKVKEKVKEKEREKFVDYSEDKFVDYVEPPPIAALPIIRHEIYDMPKLPHPSAIINPRERLDVKKAKGVMAKMALLRESFFFLQPVEAIGALAT